MAFELIFFTIRSFDFFILANLLNLSYVLLFPSGLSALAKRNEAFPGVLSIFLILFLLEPRALVIFKINSDFLLVFPAVGDDLKISSGSKISSVSSLLFEDDTKVVSGTFSL